MCRLAIVIFFLILTLLGTPPAAIANITQSPAKAEQDDWQEIRERVQANADFLNGYGWTLIHTYESKEQVDEVLKLLEVLFQATAKNDRYILRPIGGLDGFFERFLALMDSEDDSVAAFSARVLAVTAGKRYIQQISTLLDRPDKKASKDWRPPRTIRGQAAQVLSFLGASEFKERIAKLLESPNEYDRSGACFALGEFRATEYANQIASLLTKTGDGFYRDESPIDSLVAMGAASRFKKEIAAALGEEFGPEANKAAAYALAHLGAREYAPQISNLLAKRYRRGDAAKALAIMGAQEYVSKIARMLDADDAPLDQCAALLALGILKARDYAPQAAKLMRTKRKSFVSSFAAESLVLMGEQKYASEIISILKVNKTGSYIDTSDFHPLVEPEVHQVNKDFVEMLDRFKRAAKLRDAARGSR